MAIIIHPFLIRSCFLNLILCHHTEFWLATYVSVATLDWELKGRDKGSQYIPETGMVAGTGQMHGE